MSSSSSTSSSQPIQSAFSHNYESINRIINRGLIEERDNPYKDTGGIPRFLSEEMMYNYIMEYVALTAVAQINEIKNPNGSKTHKYLQIPDRDYVEKRQAKLKQIFEAHKKNFEVSKVSDNLKPFISFISDFENNLISIPDHQYFVREIMILLTTNPHNAARYLSAEAKKRKGGRRKTQYRLRKSRKGKTRNRIHRHHSKST